MLPNFLIIGAQKAGTTWLAKCLGEHPDVFIPEIKEIYFFTRHFDKGLRWYESYFADWSGEKAIGEATVSYINRHYAPERIRETLGCDIRLIASLRHPIDRAYSAYRMFRNRGRIPHDTDFCTFLDQDIFESRTLGLYYVQLGRYFDLFGRENVLVLIYEESCQDNQKVVSDCSEFLGVDSQFVPESLNARVNQGVDMSLFHYQVWGMRRAIKGLAPTIQNPLVSVGRRIFDLLPKKSQSEPLTEDLRQKLLDGFMPDIEKLECLLSRDLSLWYEQSPA